MKSRSFPFPSRAAAALLWLAAIGCLQSGDPVAKRGSEVENQVYGALVDADGNKAEGAWVRVQPASGFPLPASPAGPSSGAIDSALTDAQGRYEFRGLPAGEYNLLADRDRGALVAFIPAVNVEASRPKLDVGTDTLRAPGAIQGRITQGGAGKEGVMAYLPGTTYLAFSDSNGEFRVGGVPQGVYAVEYLIAGLAADPDTAVRVSAGRTTLLPPKELGYDTALPPPAPARVRAALDTPSSVVRVSWSPVQVADLLGYLVYRDSGTFTSPELRTPAILTDTVFLDTVLALARSPSPPVLTYRIVSVDRNKTASTRYSPPAQAVLAPPQSATLQASLRQLGGKRNRAGINDTVRIEASYANPGRRIRQVAWGLAGSTAPLRVREDTAHAGKDTLAYAWPAPGRYTVKAMITDESGYAQLLLWDMQILQDIPRADAGADREVAAGSMVHLAGIGIQEFGTITRFEWDVGATGRFAEAPEGKLDFPAPAEPGPAIPCVLRVTDEDGNQGLDTIRITPVIGRPEVDAGPDREATASDTVYLKGQAFERTGNIVKWEWDIGGAGFRASGPDTAIVLPPLDSGRVPCVFRVTTDYGAAVADTLVVRIVPDPPVAVLSSFPAEVAAGGILSLSGAGSTDGFGRIVRWEWDIGATGRFGPGTGMDTAFPAPAAGTILKAALRVTDDDGRMDTARIEIAILTSGSWTRAGEFAPPEPLIGETATGTGLGQYWFLGNTETQNSVDGPVLFSTPDFRTWKTRPHNPAWADLSPRTPLFEAFGRLWLILSHSVKETQVWSSADGDQWSVSVPKELAYRLGYATAVFADRIWIFGGMDSFTQELVNDIWSTRDGITWVRESAQPAFGPRYSPQAAVLGGQLWLYGGAPGIYGPFGNDVWRSSDGRAWTQVGQVPASAIPSHEYFLAHAGSLWLIRSGSGPSGQAAAAWHSADGKTWTQDTELPGFPPRENPPVVLERAGRMWMIESGTGGPLQGGQIWAGP